MNKNFSLNDLIRSMDEINKEMLDWIKQAKDASSNEILLAIDYATIESKKKVFCKNWCASANKVRNEFDDYDNITKFLMKYEYSQKVDKDFHKAADDRNIFLGF